MRNDKKKTTAPAVRRSFKRNLNFSKPFHKVSADINISLTDDGEEFGEIVLRSVSGFNEKETFTISFDAYPMLKKALERIEQVVMFTAQ